MPDVFISHSSTDKRAADAACAVLEARGIKCWTPRDIRPGSDWGESIITAIEQSRIMLLLLSKQANSSPQIRREVERAVNRSTIIIPVRLENVMPVAERSATPYNAATPPSTLAPPVATPTRPLESPTPAFSQSTSENDLPLHSQGDSRRLYIIRRARIGSGQLSVRRRESIFRHAGRRDRSLETRVICEK